MRRLSATLQRRCVGGALRETMSGVEAVLARVLEGAFLPFLGHNSSSAVFATFSAIPVQA